MRILHIDESFHTQYGYHTAPIVKEQAKSGHDVYVITVPADNLYPVFADFGDTTSADQILKYDRDFEKQFGVHIIRCPIRRYISRRAVHTRAIFTEIQRINPDVILSHNNDTLISIRLLLRKQKWPIVFDSHMLLMASKNRFAKVYRGIYKTFLTPRIVKRGINIIRTQDDPYVIEYENVPENLAPFVSFGTDTSLFFYSENVKKALRQTMGIGSRDFVVCYTGKLTPEKGASLLTELVCHTFSTGIYNKIVFLIVGSTKGEYGETIERRLKTSQNTVLRYPVQKYTDLPKFYQVSDLVVFPKQCSMSFYDAQACGLPVLSEYNVVNAERCSHQNGWNFQAENGNDFCLKLQQCIDMSQTDYINYRQGAIDYIMSHFDYANIAKEIDAILKRAYDLFNN